MQKALLCWFVGLLSVGSIAGCGFLRNVRAERCGDKGPCLVRRECPTCHALTLVEQANQPNLPRQPRPWMIAAQPRSMPAVVTATIKREEIPVRDQLTLLAEETAVLNSKDVTKSIEEQTKSLVESIVEKTDLVITQTAFTPDPSTPARGEESVPPLPMVEPPTPTPTAELPKETEVQAEKTVILKGAEIKFGQTDQYKIIAGQLQQFRKVWRLRYAAIDQLDPHGGSVILDGGVELNHLREGQTVRLRGELIPAPDRTTSARYRVEAIEILD